jgi:putative acetyltransferase
MKPAYSIEPLAADSPALQALIRKSEEYMSALYPAESNHFEDVQGLLPPKGVMLGVFASGEMIGCGAVKIADDGSPYGEIKRVFVLENQRGKGISKAIMQALEGHLRQRSVGLARLETGIKQPEAIGLYRRLGYVERGPFGGYKPDPLSLFMEKRLDA